MNTQNSWAIAELEIPAYAEHLTADQLPHLVTPIYRVKAQPQIILLPPFRFQENGISEWAASTQKELLTLFASEQAVDIVHPMSAKPHHSLWVDEGFLPHYEPTNDVLRYLE